MSDLTFAERLAVAREATDKGRQVAAEGPTGQNLPAGRYVGKLQRFEPGVSKNGRPQICRELLVSEGEESGNIGKDWSGVEHEVSVGILIRFVNMCGYEMPEIIDYDKSAGQGSWVFTDAFIELCKAIKGDAPECVFQVKHKNGFVNIDVYEVAAGDEEAEEAEEAEEVEEAEVDEDDSTEQWRKEVLAFAEAQGVEEATDDDDVEVLAEKIREYTFWVKGIEQGDLLQQLEAAEIDISDPDDYDPDVGLSTDDVEVLVALGIDGKLIRPTPATAKKKAATPAKKAPVRKGPKKR